MSVNVRKSFSANSHDVLSFAQLTEDTNKIHVNEDYAEESFFGERVVHGVYALGWVSSLLADLPVDGDVVLTGFDDLEFSKPIALDEEVEGVAKLHKEVSLTEMDDHENLVTFYVENPDTQEMKLSGIATIFIAESPE